MNSLDADEAIEYVNKIIDNVRCATCDKLEVYRVRYPCGHTACNDCVVYMESCPTCTPPDHEIFSRPDHPWTQTVKDATTLFKACRKLFDTDVFQRKRTSKLMKIEKEVFPKCIQAPVKYENKRKSTRFSLNNKENQNSTIFPGEAVFCMKDNKMKKSLTHVQQWLNKNEKALCRKPFSDLNVNTERINNSKNKNEIQTVNSSKLSLQNNRKRTPFKTTDKFYIGSSTKKKCDYETNFTVKRVKKEVTNLSKHDLKLCDKDESGIFMENEPIVINDSQDAIVDKDKLAWLAVLEAHNKEKQTSTLLSSLTHSKQTVDNPKHMLNSCIYDIKANNIKKVSFFKKSAIYETCNYCRNEMKSTIPETVLSQTKPVTITIDNDALVTTVTVLKDVSCKVKNYAKSMSTQTDIHTSLINHIIEETVQSNECNGSGNCESELTQDKPVSGYDMKSVDLFTDERHIVEKLNKKAEISKCLIIAESDSDSDIEASQFVCVEADVHKTCDEMDYGTLTDILNVKQHERKARRGPRGHTPTSTDSSEKENYDPNRMRKNTCSKKKLAKK